MVSRSWTWNDSSDLIRSSQGLMRSVQHGVQLTTGIPCAKCHRCTNLMPWGEHEMLSSGGKSWDGISLTCNHFALHKLHKWVICSWMRKKGATGKSREVLLVGEASNKSKHKTNSGNGKGERPTLLESMRRTIVSWLSSEILKHGGFEQECPFTMCLARWKHSIPKQ